MSNLQYCNGHEGRGTFLIREVFESEGCGCTGGPETVECLREVCGWCHRPLPVLDVWDLFTYMEAAIESGRVS